MRKTTVFTALTLTTLAIASIYSQPVTIKAGYLLEVYESPKVTPIVNLYSNGNTICNQTINDFEDLGVNPSAIIFDDPDNLGKYCEWPIGTILANLPKNIPLDIIVYRILEGGLQSEPSERKTFSVNSPAKLSRVRVGKKTS